MRRLKIHDAGGGLDQRVWLDDEEISTAVQGYTIKGHAGDLPEITLNPLVFASVEAEAEHIYVAKDAVELLKRLGWTPPEGSDGGYRRVPPEGTDG
jgi:hypothetical protein